MSFDDWDLQSGDSLFFSYKNIQTFTVKQLSQRNSLSLAIAISLNKKLIDRSYWIEKKRLNPLV